MNITVFGAGGIGGQIAARMALSGVTVNVVARGTHLEAIRTNGLQLKIGDQICTAQVIATDRPMDLGAQDVLIVSVKRTSLFGAIDCLVQLIGSQTRVVFIMNGLPWWFDRGHSDGANILGSLLDPSNRFSDIAPIENQIWGVITSGGVLESPGVVRNTTPKTNAIRLGYADDRHDSAITGITNLFGAAGYDTAIAQDIRTEVWRKILLNAGQAVVATITNRNHLQVTSDAETRALTVALIREITLVGNTLGIQLDVDPIAMTDPQRYGKHIPSLLQDLRNRRPLEIDGTILSVRALARRNNLTVPYIEAVAAIISALSHDVGMSRSRN